MNAPTPKHDLLPEPVSFELPWPLRAFSAGTDRWRESIVPFDADAFVRAARRITGLERFTAEHPIDDGAVLDRLEGALTNLRQVDFNTIGRFAVRTMLNWHLINRLHVVHLLEQRPDIAERPLRAPIIVIGLFRTGTTFLHNVLAADPDNRAGRTWEHAYPVGRVRDPLGDVRWRKRRTNIPLTMNHVVVPDQDVVHYVYLDEYEEDFFLLGTDMALMTQIVGLADLDYAWRLLDQDLTGAYRWHRLQLQMLDEQRSAARWLLKCPWHTWNLEALLRVYPDARLVHIHRDPVKALGSQCSLVTRINCRLHRDLDVRALSRFWVDYSREGLARAQRVKDSLPPDQVFDVRLGELRKAPGETIQRIYERFGLPCDDALRARFDAAAAAEPTFQQGVHEYSLEMFGLRDDEVRREFADYAERFLP